MYTWASLIWAVAACTPDLVDPPPATGAIDDTAPERGHEDFCTKQRPCALGDGDCDSDAECVAGTVCRDGVAAEFGLPELVGVCVEVDCVDGDADGICDDIDLCVGDNASGDQDNDGICDIVDLDDCRGNTSSGDSDGDGVCDDIDLCSGNDIDGDSDSDGICDDIDLCAGNDIEGDSDSDGVCDGSDECQGDDQTGDSDADGVCDDVDVCRGADSSGDADADEVCDDLDPCYGHNASGDADGDGICNDVDDCLGADNSADSDGDNVCDDLDVCRGDDTTGDSDGDGVCNDRDICLGEDSTGDRDGDEVCNDRDECRGDDQTGDADSDGVCDDRDRCRGDDATGDQDDDEVCDDSDLCRGDDRTGDGDADAICDDQDICQGEDATGDSDADQVCDDLDLCVGEDATGDSDLDGVCDDNDTCRGDDASGDSDSDGVCDDVDICSGNDAAGDSDEDTVCDDVDLCTGVDASGDSDNDGVCDDVDACPGFDDAIDVNDNGIPDACEVTGDIPRRPYPVETGRLGIKPNDVTQEEMNTVIADFYDAWKLSFVKPSNGQTPGGYYIEMVGTGPGVEDSITTSEAHGYGMIIFALMAGHDPEAKDYFDGFLAMYDDHRSTGDFGNMSWIIHDSEDPARDQGSATDGDMDIAYALLLAHAQWGGADDSTYVDAAVETIVDGVLAGDVRANNWMSLGDWAGSSSAWGTRPSDWMMGHIEAYRRALPPASRYDSDRAKLANIIDATYDAAREIQNEFSPNTGLLSEFVLQSPTRPAPFMYLDEPFEGFSENACRFPWRMALDYGHNNTLAARDVLAPVVAWFESEAGDDPAAFHGRYHLDGDKQDDFDGVGRMAYIAPMISATALFSGDEYQEVVNLGWAEMQARAIAGSRFRVEARFDDDYYDDTLMLLNMLFISGNWWAPN